MVVGGGGGCFFHLVTFMWPGTGYESKRSTNIWFAQADVLLLLLLNYYYFSLQSGSPQWKVREGHNVLPRAEEIVARWQVNALFTQTVASDRRVRTRPTTRWNRNGEPFKVHLLFYKSGCKPSAQLAVLCCIARCTDDTEMTLFASRRRF